MAIGGCTRKGGCYDCGVEGSEEEREEEGCAEDESFDDDALFRVCLRGVDCVSF